MMFVSDLEYDLMDYCIRKKGKWWATRWAWNKEVDVLYAELRALPVGEVFEILENPR